MTHDEKTLTTIAQETIDALGAWREGVKVRAHLAKLEARTAWEAVEPHVVVAEGRLRTFMDTTKASKEHVGKDVRAALLETRELLSKVEPNLEAVGDDFAKAGREIIARLKKDFAPTGNA
jgi:hypothetical protein